MKHTPGPWKTTKHATKYPDLFTYSVIQAQPDPDFNRICGIASELDSAADARLIAAAPDLLDACQTIANMDESRKGGLILDGKYAAAFITIAKQAIAKATKEDT